jgi:DUF177 domain-containing protein
MEIDNLLFDLKNIKDTQGLEVKGTCRASLFDETLDKAYKVKTVSLNLKFSLGTDAILAQGFIEGKISLVCARCNETFEYTAKESFAELYGYSEKSANIENLIASLLSISIPMKPLCSNNCKGICSKCGTNLSIANCKCEDKIENAFAILKNLAV